MNTAEIKHVLQSAYDRNNWLRFLVNVANQNNNRLKDTLHVQDLSYQFESKTYPISTLLKIGRYHTSDRQSIPIYEVELKDAIRIERNRVGVNQFIKNIVLKQQGSKVALCVFKYPGNDNPEWRFSFISKFAASQFFSDVEAKETQPKRYTYIFGTPEEHRTAIQCFQNLKNSGFNIQDFFDAFSVEKVSKDFFDGYEEHYRTLVDEISAITGNYTKIFHEKDKAVRDFSKRLLGRIVFLYFLQKKHWLGSSTLDYKDGDPDFLFTLFKESKCTEDGSDYYLHKLTELFFDTLNRNREDDNYTTPSGKVVKVPYLNGGLFDNSSEPKGYELLIIPNWVFLRLFEFLNQYNFTIDESSPEDHTVAVDPEMLGHIFENLLEDNKDKGAFYTPKEIVHYMCQESLIEYLTTHLSKSYTVYKEMGKGQVELFGNETKTGQLSLVESIGDKALDKAEIEHIVRNKDISKLTDAQLSNMDALLDSVKICDPAIGSGAFPMGLLQEIFAIKELIAYQRKTEWNPAKVKANIIQNSIYGVDIEQGAVDIAQLRFWLSLVVDEDLPTPLPNLDYKIVTGNSLITKFNDEVIEIDWDTDTTKEGMFGQKLIEEKIDLLKDLADKQKRYFDADAKTKEKLQKSIRLLTLQVLEKQLELTIETQGFERRKDGKKLTKKKEARLLQTEAWKYTLHEIKALQKNNLDFSFFDWKLNFPEVLNPYLVKEESKRGFDIVIGNPPYGVSIKGDYRKAVLNVLDKVPDYEIYYFFLEIGYDLAKGNAVLSYIIPNTFLFNTFANNYRLKLLEKWNLVEILDCTKFSIFQKATVRNTINTWKKEKGKTIGYRKTKKSDSFEELMKEPRLSLKKEELLALNQNWGLAFLLDSHTIDVISKIKNKDDALQDYFSVSQGYIPYRRSDLIKTFGKKEGNSIVNERLWHSTSKVSDDYLPEIFGRDLDKYGNIKKTKISFVKYGTHLAGYIDLKFFNQKRILVREITNPCIIASIIYDTYVNDPQLISIIEDDQKLIGLEFLWAILNSNLATFYHFNSSPKATKGAFPKILVKDVKEFPLVLPENTKPFKRIVDYLIYLSTSNPGRNEADLKITYFEQIIDGMVYELYFPELLQQHNRTIIEHLGELPALEEDMSDKEKMDIITKVYDRLNQKEHPVRNNLFYMKNIEEIKIIEGLD